MSLAAVVAPLQPGRMVPKVQKGKVAHLSASRKACLAALLPQMVVTDILVELRQVKQQRSSRLLPPLRRGHHDRVGPGCPVAHFALAAPEVGRVVLGLPLLRQRPSQPG